VLKNDFMKAAILGVGRMGTAICHGMHKLGFYVVGADSNESAAQDFRKHITSGSDGAFYLTDENNADKMMETVLMHEKPDVVISSLPYHQTEIMGYWCIDNGLRYCDLGGRVDVSKNINNYAERKATKPVFTDLGLAPGWVNILAEQGCKEIHHKIDSVEMMVGGLPAIPSNPPLNYLVTWSVDGLINEYRDDCLVLENGEIKKARGMEGLGKVQFKFLEDEELEVFYTSGGASHTIETMKARGVKNCSYKTIRYKGHRDVVKFLIRDSRLDDDCLLQIFKNGCETHDPFMSGDIVLIKAIVKAGDITWDKEVIVGYDQKFSAMQKATAFSISSIAALMAEGLLEGNKDEHRDYHTQYSKSLAYNDVPFDKFEENLKKLGIVF